MVEGYFVDHKLVPAVVFGVLVLAALIGLGGVVSAVLAVWLHLRDRIKRRRSDGKQDR